MSIINNLKQKENLIRAIARWLVYIMMLTPLLVGNNYFFPFIVPKYVFFRVLVELLVMAYLLLLVGNFQKYKLSSNLASWGVLAYFASAIISAATGVNWHTSVWGTFERMEGLFTTGHYVVLFLILPHIFRREEWVKLLRWSVAVSVLLCLYGLGQKLSMPWAVEAGRDRISATIGNPSYVAAYLLFQIGLAVYLWLKDGLSGRRWLWSGVILLQLVVFVLTLSRGPMLGLIVAIPLVLLFWLWLTGKKQMGNDFTKKLTLVRRWVAIGLLVAVVVPGTLLLLRKSPVVQNIPMLKRFTDISVTASTAKTRFMTWTSAWQGIQERPILGWGPEQFATPFNKYINPLHYTGPNSETWFDHAHNIVLDIGVTQGVVGVLAWAVFIIGLYIAAIKKAVNRQSRTLGLVVLGLLIAYVFQNLFLFDVLVVWIMLAILGGILLTKDEVNQTESRLTKVVTKTAPALAATYAALLVFVLLPVNAQANSVSRTIIVTKPLDNYKETISEQLDIFKNKIFNKPLLTGFTEVPRQLSASLLIHLKDGHFQDNVQLQQEMTNFTLEKLQEVWQQYPQDLQTPIALGKVLALTGESQRDATKIQQAIDILQQASIYSPKRIEIIYDIGLYQMALGKTNEALATFRQMVAYTPDVAFSHWNLGWLLVRDNQITEGKMEMEKALADPEFYDFVYSQGFTLQRLIDLYVKIEDWQNLAMVYRRILAINPDQAEIWGSLALTYQKLGDIANAINAADEAARINPEFRQAADELIKELRRSQHR